MWALPHRFHTGIFILGMFLISAAPAHAQRMRVLTDENIREFITETTKIIAGHAHDMPDDQMMKYLDRHLHPDARFKTVMKYNIPGYPSHEVAVSFNKSEFIDGIKRSETSLSEYDNDIKILDIKISGNQKVATVKSRNTETATMKVAGDDGMGEENVPVSGHSTCTQILAIDKGFIQMYHASCVTDIEFVQNN